MKRISVCIALSLVMCLCMFFPAGAAIITDTSLAATYDPVIDELLKEQPDGYDYYIIMLRSDGLGSYSGTTNQISIYFFNTPVVPSTIIPRRYWNSYILDQDRYISLIANDNWYFRLDLSTVSNPSIVYSTGNFVTDFGLYVADRSTARFIDHDIAENGVWSNLEWQVKFNAPVDISALQSLINAANSITNTGYTSDSWQVLQAQITAAENLLNTTGYTQSQVDAQTIALQSALDGLVLAPVLPDTIELQSLLVEADKVTDIGYTQSTWNRFTTVRANAHSLLAQSTYTALEVQTATDELRSSMSGLTLASVNPPVDPPVKPPSEYPETTFESFLGSERAPTYLDMQEGFSLAHLFPAVAGIEENMSEARNFAIWVFVAILAVYIATRILRSVVRIDNVDASGSHEKIFDLGVNDVKRSAFDSRNKMYGKEKGSYGSEYRGKRLK